MQPLYVRVHERDNVAIIVNPDGLTAGAEFSCGLRLVESVPQAHKVALRDIAAGEPVIRYGQVIGLTSGAVPRGGWVRGENIVLPAAPPLDDLPLSTGVPTPLPPLEGFTFEGYRNRDGTVGTKNILAISTTVQCVAPTVEHAVRRIKAEMLPRYPNVDDVTAVTHPYGCGVAIDAPGAEVPIRTLRNLARNPNLGEAPLLVSLGCEKLQPTRLTAGSGGLPVLTEAPVIRMQDPSIRGFQETIAAILRAAEGRLELLNRRQRVTRPASDLIVGLQCGGSDAFSGVTANPAVGYAADVGSPGTELEFAL